MILMETKYPPIERYPSSFDPRDLLRVLDGEYAAVRKQVRELISEPDFRYYEGTDVQTYREIVLRWAKRFADAGFGRIFLPRALGGEGNMPKYLAAIETLSFHDASLVTKVGVQFGLFAGSIQRLGTEYHHQKYLSDAVAATLIGCFAMTEIGHGSNVQALETTAVYEKETACFVLNSPTYPSGKSYIGNAAQDPS
jgi:acyl-CoA oxidase